MNPIGVSPRGSGPRAMALALLLAWPLQPLDDAARTWVQALRRPALEVPMHVVSDQSRVVLIAGAAAALVSGAAGRAFVLESLVALLPLNGAVEGLKWGVDRTRPDGGRDRRNSSFPSSHAANAFAVATVLTRRWRRAAIPAWLAASVVAFSRLYLDRHWLSDVLGSLALALAAAGFAAWVMHRWQERMSAARTS
jgi:membrane-associated phospholipid phosphatase